MLDEPQQPDADTAEGEAEGQPDKDWKAEAEKLKALARKHETRAKENAEKAKQYDALEQASKTELERAVDAARAEGRAEAETKAMRFEVALEKGLPPALARRLQGASREELEADADELLKLAPAAAAPRAPDLGQGARTPVVVSGAAAGKAEAARRFGASN